MIAQNNPFNILFKENISFIGAIGQEKGYVQFSSVSYAISNFILILRGFRAHNIKTIKDIITKLAPPDVSNTTSFIHFVCTRMNVHVNYEINIQRPLSLYHFMDAVSMYYSSVHLLESIFDDGYFLFQHNPQYSPQYLFYY